MSGKHSSRDQALILGPKYGITGHFKPLIRRAFVGKLLRQTKQKKQNKNSFLQDIFPGRCLDQKRIVATTIRSNIVNNDAQRRQVGV